MKYLLDTNTCIRYINGRAPAIRDHVLNVADIDIAITAITKAEMFAGAAKSQTPKRSRDKQEAFFSRFASLAFDDAAAHEFGHIRAALETAGSVDSNRAWFTERTFRPVRKEPQQSRI